MTTLSDLHIPRVSDILDRALDLRGSAERLADTATVRQLDRLVQKLPQARLRWDLGTLEVNSPSGHTYRVSRAGCDCPNGMRGHARQCWHVALFELLGDMLETEAETRDSEADRAARSLGQRIAAQRASYVYL